MRVGVATMAKHKQQSIFLFGNTAQSPSQILGSLELQPAEPQSEASVKRAQ
jgi:hypothetical protein